MVKSKFAKMKIRKDPIGFWYIVKKVYPMCAKVKPMYFVFNRTISVIQAALIVVSVLVTQIFFNSVYEASIGENTLHGVIIAFVFFIFVRFSNDTADIMYAFTFQVHTQRLFGHMYMEINKKSSQIDPVEYENPKRLDDINKAINGAIAAVYFCFQSSAIITRFLSYFVFMGIYLYNIKPLLILCILFVFVPVLVAHILRSSIFSKLEDKVAPIRREFNAYQEASSGKNFYKETRNLGAFWYINTLFVDTIKSLNKAIWSANKKNSLIDFLCNTLSLIGYGGILFLLVKYLLDGDISVGAFAAVYASIGKLFSQMDETIRGRIGNIANGFGFIRNFLRFLDIPSDNRSEQPLDINRGITVENVSFRYPNADKDSIKNVNLSIKPGETIAIVGENGAGKTTLVKLLLGLYKPTEGSIRVGGLDVNTICYKSLFEKTSGVFQKYQRYALSLGENIQIANFDDQNEKKIEIVLNNNNINIEDNNIFPEGLATMLSREFDGIDLSGGQWQRIAIARGLYRESDIIFLDEPTASIDPIEESSIYKKFIEITKDKTAVIVTHRMGSAKIAGRIVVMKDGEIAEVGTHDDLLKNGSHYAIMYAAQAGWYEYQY